MSVKLLTEQYLEFLSLKGGCTCSSESIHVKMLMQHMLSFFYYIPINDTTFKLSVFWPSDTENRINELRFYVPYLYPIKQS